MTDLIIKVINCQASREKAPVSMEFSNIDKNTLLDDYEPQDDDSNSNFEDDNKLYKPVMTQHWMKTMS